MVETVAVTPAEYDKASQFLSAHMSYRGKGQSPPFWLNRLRWWWDGNPAFSEEFERGWLLRDSGAIVGFLGVIPTRFQLSGTVISVLNSTTWCVLPQHRNASLTLILKQISLAKRTILFNTTPNERVDAVIRALNFKLLPRDSSVGDALTNSFVVVNATNALRLKLKLAANPLSPVLAPAAAPLAKLWQFLRLRKPAGPSARLDVRPVTEADASFDRLWERTQRAYSNTNVRTADVINWYCFQNRDFAKTVVGCFDGGELLGYAVVGAAHDLKLSVLECLDIWADPTATRAPDSLIHAVAEHGRRMKCDLVLFPHLSAAVRTRLQELRLFQGSPHIRKEYFKAAPSIGDQLHEHNSYFSLLQGDYGL